VGGLLEQASVNNFETGLLENGQADAEVAAE